MQVDIGEPGSQDGGLADVADESFDRCLEVQAADALENAVDPGHHGAGALFSSLVLQVDATIWRCGAGGIDVHWVHGGRRESGTMGGRKRRFVTNQSPFI